MGAGSDAADPIMSSDSALDRRRVLALLLEGAAGLASLRPSFARADDHDDDDDDDSGSGGGDDDSGGDDDEDGGDNGGGGSSGGGSGSGDDDDGNSGSGGGDQGGRPPSRGRSGEGDDRLWLRDVTVLYPDGWVERVAGGVYELIDPDSRPVVRRPATPADVARMLALR